MRWQIAQWFEKRWWIRYLKSKNTEEYLVWKTNYWKQFLDRVGVNPKGRILDAGCGPAGIFTVLNDFDVVATDPLLEYYEQNLSQFNRGSYQHVHFVPTALEHLTFRDEFDQVYCINVINHVDSISTSLQRLYVSCKVGGTLVLTTDCHRNAIFKSILKLLPLDILHPHQKKRKDYEKHLATSGWRINESILLKRAFIFDYYAFVCEKG